MSEMIERVAREIYENRYGPDGSEFLEDEPWRAAIPSAEAAIKAMREPTAAMDSVGYTQIDMHSDATGPFKECATMAWQAMIDAAVSGSAEKG